MWPDDERRRAEETLARQAQLLANVREAVIATDSGGLITCWNDGATRVFGWTVEDMLGRPFWERYPENLRDRVDEILGAVASGSDWSAVREDCRKDGTQIWIDVVVSCLTDRAGRPEGVLILAQDITGRRQAEEEARRLQNDLAHLVRISTLGEMALGIAHELSQPLSAIAGFANAAQEALKGRPCSNCNELGSLLEHVEIQSFRASKILERLRRLVRKEAPQRSSVDVNNLIDDVLALVHADAILAKIEILRHLDPALPQLVGDGVQIQQVILNLVSNAMHAVGGVEPSRRRIVISSSCRNSQEVEISVRDSGPGIPDEAAERVFDAFYTTKADGLGMGLAISRSIIESHHGQIRVESVAGERATFCFTLPLPVK